MREVTNILKRRAESVPTPPPVTSWAALADLPTKNLPLPIVRIWIDETTGSRKTTRLLASTEASNPEIGIMRPKDYATDNERVWFEATS